MHMSETMAAIPGCIPVRTRQSLGALLHCDPIADILESLESKHIAPHHHVTTAVQQLDLTTGETDLLHLVLGALGIRGARAEVDARAV